MDLKKEVKNNQNKEINNKFINLNKNSQKEIKNINGLKNITEEQREKTKKYSVLDGSSYNVMAGFGEQFIPAFAIKLGATNSEIGILSSFPTFVASLFQILSAKVTDTVKKRKLIMLIGVFIQALTWLPMFIVPFLTKNILILTLIFSIYVLCGYFVNPAWNSLMGDIVKENERGIYFGKRNKILGITSFFSILSAGLILNFFTEINVWLGFSILFTIAMLARFFSWYFLSKHTEPLYIVEEKDSFTFTEFIKKLPHTNFGKFVIFRSLMIFSIMIAAPFFVVYMLNHLHFSYLQYTIIILTPLIVRFFTSTYWGKYSDKYGNKRIMTVSSLILFLIPIGWLTAAIFNGNFFLIMLAEAISGFGWAGFDLSTFNFIFDAVSPRKRARCIAYFNVVFGAFVLIGGLIGGYLSTRLSSGVYSLIILFLVSAMLRLLVQLTFLPMIKEERVHVMVDDRKLFIEMVAVRPTRYLFNETLDGIIKIEDEIKRLGKGSFKFMVKEIDEVIADINTMSKSKRKKSKPKKKKKK
ncbi:MAG: MFS transporter [archaeon]